MGDRTEDTEQVPPDARLTRNYLGLALARVVSARPRDLAEPALWVNQHDCLGRQLLRRASPSDGEIAPDGFGLVGTGFDPERAPEKIYASA